MGIAVDMPRPNSFVNQPQFRPGATWPATLVWCLAALAGLMAVLLINGAPLFYFDSAGYLRQGDSIFQILGVFQPTANGQLAGAADLTTNDGIVIGSRSIVYAIFLGVVALTGHIWLAVPCQAAALILTTFVVCAKAAEIAASTLSPLRVTAIALLAASLGSAGFYVTSLMPDIFAPILLLSMAALVALAQVLRFWSATCLVMLAAFAVVVHPSHLAIAILMLPACLVIGTVLKVVMKDGRFWRNLALVALIPAIGGIERLSFTAAVERTTDSNVIYLPFSTARLISDGPGLTFLKDVCPTPKWATCALYAKLHSPDQLSPATILFADTPQTGSYALLNPKDRKAISDEAIRFLLTVLQRFPQSVGRAAFYNTVEQLGLVSVKMTVPDPEMSVAASKIYPRLPAALTTGRLIADSPVWVASLTRVHQAYYLLALAAVLALLLSRRSRVPASLRAFAILIMIGIVTNAFVTGAISQPADRYGARVIFLVPMLAVLLWLVRPLRPGLSPGQSAER